MRMKSAAGKEPCYTLHRPRPCLLHRPNSPCPAQTIERKEFILRSCSPWVRRTWLPIFTGNQNKGNMEPPKSMVPRVEEATSRVVLTSVLFSHRGDGTPPPPLWTVTTCTRQSHEGTYPK